METKLKGLRAQYKNEGFKRGISLQLLVDEDDVLDSNQKRELRDMLSISTLEEFYEAFNRSSGMRAGEGGLTTFSSDQLGVVARACEKYLTQEEMEMLKTQGPRYSTGALDPKKDYS